MKIICGILKVFFIYLIVNFLFCCIVTFEWSLGTLVRILIYLSIAIFILLYRNGNVLKYFWKDPQWMNLGQKLMANVGLVLALIGLTGVAGTTPEMGESNPTFTLEENNAIYMAGMAILYLIIFAIGIGGAWMYRRAFRKNMPSDIAAYEADQKHQEEMSTWMVLSEFNDPAEAHVLKDRLESNGIEVLLYGDNAPLYLGSGTHRAPVRLCVRKHQKETAERLVNECLTSLGDGI